jgi:hypothetical protein
MLLEPDPPMPLDEALRIARTVISPGAQTMIGARVVRAVLDYIEVLELETGRRRQLPTLAEVHERWTPAGPPPPVQRIEIRNAEHVDGLVGRDGR